MSREIESRSVLFFRIKRILGKEGGGFEPPNRDPSTVDRFTACSIKPLWHPSSCLGQHFGFSAFGLLALLPLGRIQFIAK